MEGTLFDETDLYRAFAGSGARVLLIGRRAVIAWGVPVITADYDVWIPADDAALLNAARAPLDMLPSRDPEEAPRLGRYVVENGERVDVLIAREVTTVDGEKVRFDDVWARRELLEVAAGVELAVPCIDDLVRTKRFAARPKDAEDIRLLRALREARR